MLKKAIFILLFFVFGLLSNAWAQPYDMDIDPILVRLKAQVVSKGDSLAVAYANVINFRNRTGASANVSGFFSLEMLNIDTLQISATGFKTLKVRIPANYSGFTTLLIYLEPVVYGLREITVTGDKNRVNMTGIPAGQPVDIAPELRGDAFNEKPPMLAALFNPMSYWQYYLSRKEKQKRRARDAANLEKFWEMHSENYNKDMVMMLTGINDQEADDFMVWFNSQNVLPFTATEYQVRSAIREYFVIYKREVIKE